MSQYYLRCLVSSKRKIAQLSQVVISLFLIVGCKDKPVDDIESQPVNVPSEYAIDAIDLNEAKSILAGYIQALSTVERLAETDISLNLSIGPQAAQEKPQYRSEPLVLPPAGSLDEGAKAYVNDLAGDMAQNLEPPNSQVTLYLQSNSRHALSEKMYTVSDARLTQINYRNAESSDKPIDQNKTQNGVISFTVPSAAIIDTLLVESTISYPLTYTTLKLNDVQAEQHVEEVTIRYQRVDAETVKLMYSAEINERILHVEGHHENGKALEQRSHSAKTLPDAEAMAYLKAINSLYQKAFKKLNKNRFSNVAELKTYINQRFPEQVAKPLSTTTEIYRFAGDVADIKLIVVSKEKNTLNKTFEIKSREFEGREGYFVAWGRSEKKFGLINLDGVWSIKPQYQHLTHNMDNYYQNGMSGQNYWLDQENKQLVAVDYEPQETLSDLLQVVKKVGQTANSENGRNHYGVINTLTREIIIPFQYAEIDSKETLITVARSKDSGDDLYAVYTTEGKLVLPERYFRVAIEEGIIYAADIKKPTITMAFTATGKKLTPEGWNAVGNFSDGLLLVEKCEKEYKACEKGFINKAGKFAFSLAQYQPVELGIFSHGYAAIRNKERLWGYINKKGQLVIPFKYRDASRFHQKYVLVTAKNGDEMLIDAKGRLFKNFKKTIVNHSYSYDRPAIYTLKDGSRYTGNGDCLPKE